MADEIVRVTIPTSGKVEMEVEGVPGPGCLEETADLVRLLGGDVEEQRLTAEAYMDVDVDQPAEEQQWR